MRLKSGKTIQLTAEYWIGNEMLPNTGEVSREDVTNEAVWTSSNPEVATVDDAGKVTGVAEGTTTITAKYEFQENNFRENAHEVTVTPGMSTGAGIRIVNSDIGSDGHAQIVGGVSGFNIEALEMTLTEEMKNSIQITSSDESIAKIKSVPDDNAVTFDVTYLSAGSVTITAMLKYNDTTYTDTFEVTVTELNLVEPKTVKGDINGDGEVTVTDLLILKQFLVGIRTELP